jgi:hypothetical protein
MTSQDRVLADSFLDELARWRLADTNPPIHQTQRRMMFADMILTELRDDNLEYLALRSLAAAALDLCMFPDNVAVAETYLAARRAHVEAFVACWPI